MVLCTCDASERMNKLLIIARLMEGVVYSVHDHLFFAIMQSLLVVCRKLIDDKYRKVMLVRSLGLWFDTL